MARSSYYNQHTHRAMRSHTLLFTLAVLAVTFSEISGESKDGNRRDARTGTHTHTVLQSLLQGRSHDDLHSEALNHARSIAYAQALPLFEEAARLQPSNANYHNNVGVTHLRMQSFSAAEKAFRRALAIDPTHADARNNLQETLEYLKQQGGGAGGDGTRGSGVPAVSTPVNPLRKPGRNTVVGVEHATRPLPRIHIDHLHDAGNAVYAAFRAPFVLVGLVKNDTALERAFRLSRIASAYPDANADFYPHNMGHHNVHPYMIPMSNAIEEFQRPSGRYPQDPAKPGTYIQWNMHWGQWTELFEGDRARRLFRTFPYYFTSPQRWLSVLSSDKLRTEFQVMTHWRMMLIGGEGSGMFNHQDTLKTASYNFQIRGAKRWHICAPDQSLHLSVDLDTFHPDYEKFPQAKKANCYLDTVAAGEMVYYPNDYWHQTQNLPSTPEDAAISYTDTLVDPEHMHELARQLREKCDRKIRTSTPFSDELCGELDKIFEWWYAGYPELGKLNATLLGI